MLASVCARPAFSSCDTPACTRGCSKTVPSRVYRQQNTDTQQVGQAFHPSSCLLRLTGPATTCDMPVRTCAADDAVHIQLGQHRDAARPVERQPPLAHLLLQGLAKTQQDLRHCALALRRLRSVKALRTPLKSTQLYTLGWPLRQCPGSSRLAAIAPGSSAGRHQSQSISFLACWLKRGEC